VAVGANPRPVDLARLQDRLAGALLPIVPVAGEDGRAPMAHRLAHYGCPGVAVAVLDDGRVAWSGGFGVTEHGGAPVTADTVFAGASISKPLTAVLVMQQVERGRLDLDADVNRYLQAWQVPDNEHTRRQPVTLRHLLSHRAGTTVHGFGGLPPEAPRPGVLDTLRGQPPATNAAVTVDKTPGGSIRYSGGGYTVAQLVLEEVTGRSFAELAQAMIFRPLEMHGATFEAPLPPALAERTAAGHDAQGQRLSGRLSLCPQAAAGGVYLTAGDYARFMGAFRDAWLGRHTPLLQPHNAREMVAARGDGDFGLGWRVLGESESLRIAHGGSNEGYQCETTCFLASGRGAVVLTNAVSGALLYWEVLNTIADVCDWPGFLRAPRQVVSLDAAERARLAGRYRIVSGVDAPYLDLIDRDGQAWAQIVGHRAAPVPVLMDETGRLFNRYSPFESAAIRDATGRVVEIVAYDGNIEILRARRDPDATPGAAAP
jgi:CubicO group peptidase (beta-lactamase class C family)